jgi:hypothetical protein
MRAWTIVLFILAVHAVLAMMSVANITDVGMNISIDTTSHTGYIITNGAPANVSLPADSTFFNASANATNVSSGSGLTSSSFVNDFIESILGVANAFGKYMSMFNKAIFSIYFLTAPYFGSFNAMVLEGMVDIIFGISLIQMVTGRSFKTME